MDFDQYQAQCSDEYSRRKFLKNISIGSAGLTGLLIQSGCNDGNSFHAAAETKSNPSTAPEKTGDVLDITLNINGKAHNLSVEPRTTLLDLLRNQLNLTGTKKGCDHGQCGACTVLINGRAMNSCLALAVVHSGSEITTIEGLGSGENLHPVQAAFIKHDAFQCGYCTCGQIMSAVALINDGKRRNDDEIREAMSGNLCRCGAYPNIVAAIQDVQSRVHPHLEAHA